MEGSYQMLEKTADFHNRIHFRKPSDKDHKSLFDVPSQPARNLANQRLLLSAAIRPKLAASQPGDAHEQEA